MTDSQDDTSNEAQPPTNEDDTDLLGSSELADESSRIPEMPHETDTTPEAVGAGQSEPNLSEHSPETPEIQVQDAAVPGGPSPGAGTVAYGALKGKITKRYIELSEVMSQKESLQLKFVFDKVPFPYYATWKGDGNRLFRLLVELKGRRQRQQERITKKNKAG